LLGWWIWIHGWKMAFLDGSKHLSEPVSSANQPTSLRRTDWQLGLAPANNKGTHDTTPSISSIHPSIHPHRRLQNNLALMAGGEAHPTRRSIHDLSPWGIAPSPFSSSTGGRMIMKGH
jgi:hypothetical protein